MIDLRKLPPEGLRLQGQVARLRLAGGDDLRDLDWSLFLLPSDRDLFVDVQGHGVWEGACARCAAPMERALKVESRFLGSGDSDLVARGSHTLGTQDLDVVFLPESELDEAELVREQFELQVPMSPLCAEDCKGLCPRCGKNWNKGPCACRPEEERKESALARALSGLKLDLPK